MEMDAPHPNPLPEGEGTRSTTPLSQRVRAKPTLLVVGWLIVIASAIALRIWMWSFQARSGAVPPGDAEEYYRSALHILQGGYYDTGKWLRPPLYPAFLALCFSLFGVDLGRTLLVQAILSGVSVPAFGWLAKRLFGGHSVALLAGLIAALFVPLASFGSVMFAEELFVILIVLALAALDWAITASAGVRRQESEVRSVGVLTSVRVQSKQFNQSTTGIRAALLAGILFGLAALTRAAAVSFIPLAAILVTLPTYSYTLPPLQILQHRHRFRLAAALLLGAGLVIGPWALRNAIVHQRLILSDTNGGISMWYGVVRSDAEQRTGEAQLWAIANPADRQSLALRWTAAKIIQDPIWFVGRMRFKIASLYLLQIRSFAVGDSITIDPRDQLVAMGAGENPLGLSAIADCQYILIMLAAIAGICIAPNHRKLLPIVLWVVFVTFMSSITIGHPRLRLPIVALLIPCAAYGLKYAAFSFQLSAFRRTKKEESGVRSQESGVRSQESGVRSQHTEPRTGSQEPSAEEHSVTLSPRHAVTSSPSHRITRSRYRIALMLVGWLIFFALIFSTRYVTWVRAWPDLWMAHAAMASSEYNAARTYFERAQTADPTNALRVIDLADLAFQRGDTIAALDVYGQALKLEDRNLYAHALRARTAALLGRADIAAAEQVALAGYGRDNNEVYDWAWRSFDDLPSMRVVPGDPIALGQYVGFAPATPNLPTGRWTLGDARIRLADGCGQVVIRVRGPVGRNIALTLEGRDVQQSFTLNGTEQELHIAIACSSEPAIIPQRTAQPALVRTTSNERLSNIIRIQSPTSLLDIEQAPWYTGVAVIEARIE